MRFLIVAIACGALGVSVEARAEAPGAHEGAPETRRQRDLKAYEAFLALRYQESLELTTALYADFPEPIYLRNLGRCHQLLEHPDAAIYYFTEYLSKERGLDPRQVAEVQGFIRQMAELKGRNGATPTPAPPPTTRADEDPWALATTTPRGPRVPAVSPEPAVSSAPDETAGLSRPGALGLAVGLGAVGVAAVVVGSVFGLQAKAKADQSNDACAGNVCSPDGKELRDEALRKADVSTIAFIAGGAFLGAGLYFWLSAPPAQTPARLARARSARFTPQVSAQGALVFVGGEF